MYYINKTPTDNGNYGNPQSNGNGYALPDSLLDSYIATMGFAIIALDGDTVTAVEVNQDALDAYLAEHPDVPPQPEEPIDPQPTIEERMTSAEEDISTLADAVNILLGEGEANAQP